MSEATPRHPVTLQKVVYTMRGTDEVTVRREVAYRTTEAGPCGMDIYYPAGSSQAGSRPAVIFVIGFPGAGARARLGCTVKEMESYVGWARLVAASGMTAILYDNRDPVADLHAVFDHIRHHAAPLGVDASRLAVWAASGSGPMGLMATLEESVKCAVLLYPYLLDLDGATGVAEAAMQWGFVNAGAGKSIDDVSADVTLFIVRAGRDQFAGVKDSIDRFVAGALARNRPIHFVNYADAEHAFDVSDDRPTTHGIIRSVLAFLQSRLLSDTIS
jgi:dienelactone hydrolase